MRSAFDEIIFKRQTVTTFEVAAHFRVSYSAARLFFIIRTARFPTKHRALGWTRDDVQALAREINRNRRLKNTVQVAKLLGVTPQTIFRWMKRYDLKPPERIARIGCGGRHGRVLFWSRADIRRAAKWKEKHYKKRG